ncbi:MAG: integrase family protein [Pseudomonadota bacterium]
MPVRSITEAWLDNPNVAPGLYWAKSPLGLGCRVGKTGTKAFLLQRHGGARITIGRWPEMGLQAAKERAVSHGDGLTRRAGTLAEAFAQWAEEVPPDTAKIREQQMRKHMAEWWDRPLTKITKTALQRIKKDIESPWVARDVISLHGTVWRYVTDEPWPGRNVRQPKKPPKSQRKRRRIEDREAWATEIRRRSPHPDMWIFIALTGLRRGDICRMRWEHLRDGWLHIPTPKMGEAFDIPLCRRSRAILDARPRVGEWVWPYRSGFKAPSGMPGAHQLRHIYRSVAESVAEAPFPIVARLMDHRERRGSTDLYGEDYDTPERLMHWAERIGDAVAAEYGLL